MISATEATMMPPARIVRMPTSSSRISQPRNTATTGFTYA